jgi:hypothetical protein
MLKLYQDAASDFKPSTNTESAGQGPKIAEVD